MQANPLCNDARLPPLPIPYCLEANRSENPHWQPAAFDFDGSCPVCRLGIRSDGDGVALEYHGDVPFQFPWHTSSHNQAGMALSHAVDGSLRDLTTSFARIGLTDGHGLYEGDVAVWFEYDRPASSSCAQWHHWLAVGLGPSNPLVPPMSRDVLYRGPAEQCGGMFVFNATGPTVHWTPGGPLAIDWCALLDAVHAKGAWSDVICDATHSITEFVVATGWTPGGQDAPLVTGGVTVRLAGWTSSR